ncbi:Prefoldin [Corchorus olitorius]|uniref:Prefoldin n=1 Tax=Corchorus olitorius TaxID=93759 RepID=A0A1R3INA0_9ROSI|nr:Prefoldin [Corchorus olitorius]
MFRLHKTRPAKSGEKIDFKFSSFKAVQVPKGWDRLFMSIISLENGKTIAKTSKTAVRSGTCQWTEILSESVWVSRNEASKEMEDCLFKLVVAMGSARSGILGEATVNLTSYITSTAIVPVSLPLKKCNHGTILHVKIQCVTPRPKLIDDEAKQGNSHAEGNGTDPSHISLNSDGPESVESPSSQDLVSATHQEEVESRVASFSTADSNHSYDSAESTIGRESFSAISNSSVDATNLIQKQDSCHLDDSCQSNHSIDSQIMSSESASSDNQQEFSASSLKCMDSSKNLLEAAEKTIEELHAEAKMWERKAEKLALDLDLLRKEYSDQSKKQFNMDMELSAANAERDGLRKEVGNLKLLLENPMVISEDSTFQEEGVSVTNIQKELENEIKFQKESNANLALQLQRSQDANVELISVLQELEETIEKQRVDLENISTVQSQSNEQAKESEKNLQDKVELLEKALKDKEDGMTVKNDALLVIEEEYNTKLAAKEAEIISLKVKLAESLKERKVVQEESRKGSDAHLIREIEALKVKLEELERDCNELTEENLDLLLKLKDTKNNFSAIAPTDFSSDELSASTDSEMSENKSQMVYLEEKLKRKILREIQGDYKSYVEELESQKMGLEVEVTELGKELAQKMTEMQRLKDVVLSKEDDNVELRRNQSELEAEVSNLQQELERIKHGLEIHLSELEDENKQSSLRLSDLEAQLQDLQDERDSIQLQLREMEARKIEMEKQLQDMHEQWLTSQDRCEYLSRENTKLQANIETLIEECNSLQKSAEELEEEKSKLGEHCDYLEAKLKESDKSLSDCRKMIEVLEENLTLMIEEFASKEKNLTLELKAVHDKNKKLEAKVQNLQQEVETLAKQISSMHHENEKTAYEAQREISGLHADKSRLKSALQEAEYKVNCMESEFKKMQTEAKTEVEYLLSELATSRENQEKLMADHEKALKLLEGYKSSEEKLETIVNGLELKLTVSEYERQQVSEQCNAIKSDKEKLEASLRLVSRECDDLKVEKTSFVEQISFLQKVVSESEEYKQKNADLEEKLVAMESELTVKEALLIQDAAGVKTEINQVKRTNRQFQQQIKQLQVEKDELLTKAQTLEEKLKLKMEDQKQKQRQSNSHRNQHKREDNNYDNHEAVTGVDAASKIQFLENELAKAMEANNKLPEGRRSQSNTPRKSSFEGEVVAKEKYERTKSSLEAELKDIRERYLHMSLKYAEVEAQREELVMKLKGVKNIRRWFSNPTN